MSLTKIAGSGVGSGARFGSESGSVSQRYGSATLVGTETVKGTIRGNTGNGTWKQCCESGSGTFCSGDGTGIRNAFRSRFRIRIRYQIEWQWFSQAQYKTFQVKSQTWIQLSEQQCCLMLLTLKNQFRTKLFIWKTVLNMAWIWSRIRKPVHDPE